jgi:cellulose synthase/poly-beta-1,6-N-acetylglucosamine synthase-like glycosyltransferase
MEMALSAVLIPLGLLVAVLWLSPLSDLLSCLTVLYRRRVRRAHPGERDQAMVNSADRPRLLFVIPAHNEERLIVECLTSLQRMNGRNSVSDILVLLDACSDGTAAATSAAGVRTLALSTAEPLGKARLLEHAIRRGVHQGYDALVIVDSDSTVAADFADILAASPALRTIVQQGYHGLSNPDDSWLTRLASLLNGVRYESQLPLRAEAGLNAPLTGNGMCIGSAVLEQFGLHCTTIKEDLELYARYTLSGVRILYQPRALVYAHEATSIGAARTQRIRWEAGKWDILRVYGLSVLISRWISLRQRIDALAEITHHGPVVHATIAIAVGNLLLNSPGIPSIMGAAALATTIPLIIGVAITLFRRPDRLRLLVSMAGIPVYLVWRMGILLIGILPRSRKRWIRSPR